MIAEALRGRILKGEIPTGARLQQNDVAAQFGVSSTPVREAFAELRRQGLVSASEHRGVRVFRPTLADVIEASEVLELLEGPSIAASAPLLTDEDLAAARRLMEKHRRVGANQFERRLQLDTEFHMALLVRCPNTKLRNLAEQAHRDTVVHKMVLAAIEGEHLMATIYEQHEAIWDACAERSGEKAAARTVDHIRWGGEISRQNLS
ncbi:GntR family transcriptional regulator [Mycobacterium deserti]|uniref:GntR family transcriptional regulator n=1 Tax=Mycobacterium deserti TaxID=2978347 RepID=A0ABT2MI84_9MYCO|nr:GntR family transcriptional regulator [Mycobacterium deserti]MCT7660691.1 GntR family transcriptional regulator [Mycobacterium deserti]